MDVEPSGGGTVEIDQNAPSSYPITLSFRSDTSVILEAVSASGYHFDRWSGDLSGSANPATIVIDCNKKITANFSQIMHTLTMQVSGGGSTTPTVGTHSYSEGTVVSITATPDSGWQFDRWTGGLSDPDSANTTVTVDSDKTVSASFSQVEPSLWLIGGAIGGSVIVGVIVWWVVRNRKA